MKALIWGKSWKLKLWSAKTRNIVFGINAVISTKNRPIFRGNLNVICVIPTVKLNRYVRVVEVSRTNDDARWRFANVARVFIEYSSQACVLAAFRSCVISIFSIICFSNSLFIINTVFVWHMVHRKDSKINKRCVNNFILHKKCHPTILKQGFSCYKSKVLVWNRIIYFLRSKGILSH